MLSLVGTAADERDVSCSVLDPDHDDHDTSLPDMRCFWRQTLSSLPPSHGDVDVIARQFSLRRSR